MTPAEAITHRYVCGRPHCPCERSAERGQGKTHCMVHTDPSPSLNVTMKSGTLTVYCHGGCSQDAVVAALRADGLWPESTEPVPFRNPQNRGLSAPGAPVAIYAYRTADGKHVADKGRFENPDGSKDFKWRLPGADHWGLKGMKVSDIPLWGAEMVASEPDAEVWVVEGEKAAEACRARGLLAVTFGGGASTKDFGKAFEVVAGRRVNVWPDNDPPGRAYMALVKAHLEGLGCRVRPVVVNVRERGDAFDYFAAGGTIEAIFEKTLGEPLVEYLSEDAIRVRMSSIIGVVAITCSEMMKGTRSLDAQVEVRVIGPPERDPLQVRCDLESMSKVTELQRLLDKLHGEKDLVLWLPLLTRAFALVKAAFLSHDPSQDAADIEASDSREEHVEVLTPRDDASVIFGDGSAGKTMLCQNLMLCCAAGEQFLGLETKPGPWLFVDYESTPATFRRRLNRMCLGFGMDYLPRGLIHYWRARGTPIPDMIPALRKKIRENGIVGVVIDSAVAACGGDPMAPDVTIRYFNSLSKLEVTTITIAHIGKGGDTEKPFGSAFWHHMPRATWFAERVQRVGADVIDMQLINRKGNDDALHAPLGVSIMFDGRDGGITVRDADTREVPEFAKRRNLTDRIAEVLAAGDRPIHEIATELDEPADSVKKALQRGKDARFVQTQAGGGSGNQARWGLLAPEPNRDNGGEADATVPF